MRVLRLKEVKEILKALLEGYYPFILFLIAFILKIRVDYIKGILETLLFFSSRPIRIKAIKLIVLENKLTIIHGDLVT
ncbi:hypothetical protein MY3296_008333 [Beauveria thailandica]